MATLTIRNLDDRVRDRLRTQAAGHGRSMEAEARDILGTAVGIEPSFGHALLTAYRDIREPDGIPLPPRSLPRDTGSPFGK